MKFKVAPEKSKDIEVVWSLQQYGEGISLHANGERVLEINPTIRGISRNFISDIPGVTKNKFGYIATHTEFEKGL